MEPLIYIDDSILRDIREDYGDGRNKDDILFFKENIKEVNDNFKKGFKRELKGGRKV